MDLEEVYLRQIVEQLKLQNKLKEDGNDLLKEILNKDTEYINKPFRSYPAYN